MKKYRAILLSLAGFFLLLSGVAIVFMWSSFSTLYVPECETFGIFEVNPRCRNPVIWIYVGYSLVMAGFLVLAHNVVQYIRRLTNS